MSDTDEKNRAPRDTTHVGAAPPAVPQPPAEPSPPRDPTQVGAAPPPRLPVPPASGAEAGAAPPAVAAAPQESADEQGTVFLDADAIERRPRVLLNREQPPGHPGSEILDADQYLLGRSRTCDIKLFSPTASREHARLTRRADGWYIESYENKVVLANGSLVRQPTRLEHRMRLQLGGDELVVIDQGAAIRSAPAVPTPSRIAPRRRRWPSVAALVALAAAALAAAWLLFRD